MKRIIWLPITLLVLSSLACGLFGRAEEIIDAGQDAATAVAEVGEGLSEEDPVDSPDDGAVEPEIEDDALDRLESYRMRMTTEWVPEEGEPDRFTMEQSHTREPRAQRVIWGDITEAESMEFVQIGEQAWSCSAGRCSEMPGDPDDFAASFDDPGLIGFGLTSDDAYDSLLGRETVNGVQTRQYALNLTPLEAGFLAEGDVSDLSGEAWIADDPDLPTFTVRFEMSWTEKRQERTGRASVVYEVYDVNVPFTIEPPEGVERIGLPEDVPLYPDTEQQFSMEGMVALETPDSPAEVAEFYREEMAAEGWSLEADDDMDELVQQRWVKGPNTVTVMIRAEGDGTGLMITFEGAR